MSTSASLDARSHNREHPTPRRARMAGSAPSSSLDDPHAAHGRHADPELAHLHAEWADVAPAIVTRRGIQHRGVPCPTLLRSETRPASSRQPAETA